MRSFFSRAAQLVVVLLVAVSSIIVVQMGTATAARVPVCSTTELIGSDGSGNLYRFNPTTGASTLIQTTALTATMNGLASNSDVAMVYWGYSKVVYYWDPLGDVEGVLVDLTGLINGNIESAGGTYRNGWYYFGTEAGSPNSTAGLYRIQIDNAGGGSTVVPGTLELLETNEPEDTLAAHFGRDIDPDYGDIVSSIDGSGNVVIHGSTQDGLTSDRHFWKYEVATGTITYISTTSVLLQLARLGSVTYGSNAGTVYSVNTTDGTISSTATTTMTFIDLGNEFCTAVATPDFSLTKSVTGVADNDGSNNPSAGDVVTYAFSATNVGNVPLTSVSITDPLSGLSALSCTPTAPASLALNQTMNCTATRALTAADITAGSVANTATVSGSYGATTVTDSATATVSTTPPQPTVTKTSNLASADPGDTISYTVTVTNSSGYTLTGITVDDPLPSGANYDPQSTTVVGYASTTGPVSRTYDNTTAGTVSDTTTPCSAPFLRTFVVSDAMTVTDVNLGLNIDHTRRGQLAASLVSPTGTVVNLAAASADIDDNYDVLFDSASSGPLDDDGNNDNTAAPYYTRLVGPATTLNSFNGEAAIGTWTLRLCDDTSSRDGSFSRAQLQLGGTGSVVAAVTKDNVPAGVNADLTSGVPTTLVTAADGFQLTNGQSMTITYRLVVTDPFTGSTSAIDNTVSVDTAQGPPTTATNSVAVVDFAPLIQVVKSGPATASIGDTVTYSFVVSHAAGSDGSDVTSLSVSDDISGAATYVSGDTDSDARLDAGETWTYSATYTIPMSTADPLVNVAAATGTDLGGGTVSDTDSHSLDVLFAPTIQVTKSGPATGLVGDTATYTYAVSHAGSSDGSPVSSLTVGDNVSGTTTYVNGDTDNDTLLDAGETWNFTDTHVITSTSADPLVNTATASGTDRDGDTTTDTDTHSLNVAFAPVIQIVKSGPGTANVGDTVTYTYAVSHTGTSDGSTVSGLGVTDDITGTTTYVSGDTDNDTLLDTDETWAYTDSHTITVATPDPLVNTATASGTNRDGDSVSDTDTHSLNVTFAPLIQIVKSGPATANVGDTVTYTYAVSHTGTSDGSTVSGLNVTDDITGTTTYVSGDTDNDNLLDTDETWAYTDSHTITVAAPDPLVNTATASGTNRDGDSVSDTDSHSLDIVYSAMIQVVKSGPASAVVGDNVTYTFVVTHDASSDGSPIHSVSVVDNVTGGASYVSGDTNTDTLLDSTETWTYTDSHVIAGDGADPLVNIVTASGLDVADSSISDTDTHTLAVSFAPIMQIVKSGPTTANVGDTITYTFAVSHAGTSDGSVVSGLTVTDDVTGSASYVSGDTDNDTLLDALETWTFSDTHLITSTSTDPLINTATATGTDRDGDTVSDTDSHSLPISFVPVIQVVKSGPATANVGDTVTYTYAVTHTGTSDGSVVSGLTVTDDITGTTTYVGGDIDNDTLLDAAETWTFTDTYTITATSLDPLVNTATATGTDRDGDTASDTDTHSLPVSFVPVIQIVKSGPATALVGDTVTYTFAVSHAVTSDGSVVSGLTVTDDITGTTTYVGGDTDNDTLLDTAETWTYTDTHTITGTTADPLVNTATATGTDRDGDRDGDPTTDTDTHSLDIIPVGSISGRIWIDDTRDGQRQAGEPAAADVTVTLLDSTGTPLRTNTTSSGLYSFEGVRPGSYRVRFGTPFGLSATTQDLGPDATDSDIDGGTFETGGIAINGNDVVGIDAGWLRPLGFGDITGTLWLDVDEDDAIDVREPRIGSVQLAVTGAGFDNTFGTGDDTSTVVTTDSVGHYEALHLPAGNYRVAVANGTLPAGLDVGADPDSITDGITQVTVIADVPVVADFGYVGTGSIGDLVWLDVDKDGEFDAGEPVSTDAKVAVLWAGFDGVFGTTDDVTYRTSTDASGGYRVIHLPPGVYDVTVDPTSVPPTWTVPTGERVDLSPGESDLSGDVPLVSNQATRPPLPRTGASLEPMLMFALTLVWIGSALVAAARKRRSPDTAM